MAMNMFLDNSTCAASKHDPQNTSQQIDWSEQYPLLHALSKRLVYKYRLPRWYGQEEDIADDVTQETIKRFIERMEKAERGEATPIDTPMHMMAVIALHYLLDLRRRERKLVQMPGEELPLPLTHEGKNQVHPEEVAIQNVYDGWLFHKLASEIALFPKKQRIALLTDLANSTFFEEQPTQLQSALRAAGINLQNYQLPLPAEPTQRAQHTSSLYWARKRLAQIASLRIKECEEIRSLPN